MSVYVLIKKDALGTKIINKNMKRKHEIPLMWKLPHCTMMTCWYVKDQLYYPNDNFVFFKPHYILELNSNVAKYVLNACFQQGKNALLVTDLVIASVLLSVILSNSCLLKGLTDRFISCQNPKIQTTKLTPPKTSPKSLPKPN